MRVLVEAWRSAVSQPVSSIVIALVVAGVCAAILSTTGQTVQAEQEVLSRIDAAGTRSIIITDTQGNAGLNTAAVDRIAALTGVEWVVGFGPASDVRAAGNPGGNPVAIRSMYGAIPPQVQFEVRELNEGEALVGPDAQITLGLQTSLGGVTSKDSAFAVVGPFIATEPLAFLNTGLLRRPLATEQGLRSIHVLAATPDLVDDLTTGVLMVLGPQDPRSVAVETSETLAEVRAAIQGELGRFGRNIISLVLGAGLVLTALAVYSSVSSRRRDFGRRRALGATRPTIVALVAAQTALAATFGAVGGTLATATILAQTTDSLPDAQFATAIIVLAILSATFAALPPALIAAYRDPVHVLRVP